MKVLLCRPGVFVLVLALSATAAWAQGNANFTGAWKLDKFAPPLPPGRGGRGAPSPGGAGYDETAFGAISQKVVITQTANDVTVEDGPRKATYKLDGSQNIAPPGDVSALKTWAHWEGGKLHLHFKQGQAWGRDVLSLSGGTMSILLDLEAGGGSTTRTLVYSKAS